MIAAVALALQLSAALPAAPPALAVRSGAAERMVPLEQTNTGPAVPVEMLAPVIPLNVSAPRLGTWTLSLPGMEVVVREQLPFVVANGELHQLSGAPYTSGGRLYVPFQLVAELFPRLVPQRLVYDARRGELRQLGATAGQVADANPQPSAGRASPAASTATQRTPPPASPGTAAAPASATPRRVYRVVVDAGHGGHDPGTAGPLGPGPKIQEKHITLAVALEVERILKARGVQVIMTRRTDVFIPLGDRGKIANDSKGDVFVSIHVNGPNLRWRNAAAVRGFETYFLSTARTEDEQRVAAMENESMRFETEATFDPADPLAFILRDMAQNEHLRESSELAELMQRHLATSHPGPNRGVKQAGFVVLVRPYMPSVLVEIGFASNAAEIRWMNSVTGRRQIATAIADATMEYLDHYDRKLGTAAK